MGSKGEGGIAKGFCGGCIIGRIMILFNTVELIEMNHVFRENNEFTF